MGNFTDGLIGQATGAIGSVVNAGLGLALAGWQDKRQLKQQAKLQQLQEEGARRMQDYQNQQAYAMWQKTGPVGQMKQLQEAGLNPALMYGMGGATGGSTQASGATPTGGSAAAGSGEVQQLIGMGLQREQLALQRDMQQAQIELTKNQAANVAADTQNKTGGERQKLEMEVLNLGQDIENKKAQQRLTSIQADINDVELEIKTKSKDDALKIISEQAKYWYEEAESGKLRNLLSVETMENQIKLLDKQIANLLADTELKEQQELLTKAGIGLTNASTRLTNANTKLTNASTQKVNKEMYMMEYNKVMDGLRAEFQGREVTDEEKATRISAAAQELQEKLGLPKAIGEALIGAGLLRGMTSAGRTVIGGFKK